MHRSTSLVGPTARWQKHLPPFTQGHLLPAPVTQSLSIASLDQLWILTTCCQPGRSLHGYQKKALPQPQACVIRHQLQCPAQPGAHCPVGHGLFTIMLIFCATAHSLILEQPDSGVGLRPSPWSCSIRVSMDRKVLSCQGRQDPRRTQLAALALGKSDKVHHWDPIWALFRDHSISSALSSQEGPASPSKSLACDTCSCDAPTPAGSFPERLREPELADRVDLGHFQPHCNNRTSGLPCSSLLEASM